MKIYKSYLLSILLFFGHVSLMNARDYSQAIARERLMQDIFTNNNPHIRPSPTGKRLDLRVRLELHHFDFLARDGSFEFFGKLFVSWSDHKLGWTPWDYNNVSEVYVHQSTIWIPDLEVYNNAPNKFIRMENKGLVLVESTGLVTWVDTIEVNIFCVSESLRWPNDRHSCKLVLGSWTYDANVINFDKKELNSSITNENIAKNSEFKLLNHTIGYVTTVYSCCEEPYVALHYHLELERRASFAIIFQMPALCVILLTLGAFCLEPHRGEKLLLHGISILLIVFQLIYFAKNMRQFQYAQSLPMCVIFYSISMVLVTFATILSVFGLWASRSKIKCPPPPGFLRLLKSRLGALLDTASPYDCKSENSEEINLQFENDKFQESCSLIPIKVNPDEWTRFAFVVDRIAFGVYCLIYFILGSICFI